MKSIRLPFAFWDVQGLRQFEQTSAQGTKFREDEIVLVITPVKHGVEDQWQEKVLRCSPQHAKMAIEAIRNYRQISADVVRGGVLYGIIRVRNSRIYNPKNTEKWLDHPSWVYANRIVSAEAWKPQIWPFACPRSKRRCSDQEWAWILSHLN